MSERHLLKLFAFPLILLAAQISAPECTLPKSSAQQTVFGQAPQSRPQSTTDTQEPVAAQDPGGSDESEATPRYVRMRNHDPNGIGKFYMGREIARVMGFGFEGAGAAWLERDSREREENLSLLIKSLELKPGMAVADIGAGSGVISLLMAEQVGNEGQILAVDIQDEMLNRLRSRAEERGITNVKPVKGTVKSPRLMSESVDLVIMVDVYHEFEYPYEMLLEISKSLKTGGRVAFVEYRKEDPTVPIKLVHKMTEAQVKKEAGVRELQLKFKETIGVLPRQHIVVFEKLAAPAASDPES